MLQVIQKLDVLAKKLLNQIASILSLPETAFTPLLEGPCPQGQLAASALEAIHYHSPEEILHPDDAEDASADCGAHAYKALLKLIYADTEQGLQVRPLFDN